jgi:hypothetical protein
MHEEIAMPMRLRHANVSDPKPHARWSHASEEKPCKCERSEHPLSLGTPLESWSDPNTSCPEGHPMPGGVIEKEGSE